MLVSEATLREITLARTAARTGSVFPDNVSNVETGGFEDIDTGERITIEQAHLATYSLLDRLRNDPASIGFPAMLPVELALGTGKVSAIFAEYGLTIEDYHRLKTDHVFLEALAKARKMTMTEGWSFKMKAMLQSEELLKSSWAMIHSADTPASVKKDLIIATWRAAGLADPEQTEGSRSNFSITLNLG